MVKTILRFKSVCKPWRDLFSTPEFRKLHHSQFSIDPKKQSFIVHSFRKNCSNPKNQFSIFKIDSSKKRPTIVDDPFAHTQDIEFLTVGCCNGLVCIFSGLDIVLWNPAMKLSKTFPIKDYGPFEILSFGFGYDAAGADFKVVMIFGKKRRILGRKEVIVTSAEMYSVNLDSWTSVNVSIQFSGFTYRNDVIVNGNPHWVAWVNGNKGYVCFDVMELVFKFVPMRIWNTEVGLVDWNGALASISYTNDNLGERVDPLCVWVFDDDERVWRKKHTFGPLEKVDVFIFYHLTKNEKLLCCFKTGKLFVLDLETGSLINCLMALVSTASMSFFSIPRVWQSLKEWKSMSEEVN
ncbi:hypothetical protein CASFOL_027843 [Castilleja foliolosa]|uniref:F-box associated beta-propeller type 3 domain-containing protein n=1 Tax=Castilleja foliolosa TaxID=1961234 RepID=A0ABD3CGV4_9LAMI